MPLIKKLLFPVGFSDSCLGASRNVEAFAGRFEAGIMLLYAAGMGDHNLAEDCCRGERRNWTHSCRASSNISPPEGSA